MIPNSPKIQGEVEILIIRRFERSVSRFGRDSRGGIEISLGWLPGDVSPGRALKSPRTGPYVPLTHGGKLSRVIPRPIIGVTLFLAFTRIDPLSPHFARPFSSASPSRLRDRRARIGGEPPTFVRRSRPADCKSAVASPKSRAGMTMGETPILRMQCRRPPPLAR